ncbi:MAG: hypothetical protein WC045_00070 [Patescibacteria group bacterium]
MKNNRFIVFTGLLTVLVAGMTSTAKADTKTAEVFSGRFYREYAERIPNGAAGMTDVSGKVAVKDVCLTNQACVIDASASVQDQHPNRCDFSYVIKPGGCDNKENLSAQLVTLTDGREDIQIAGNLGTLHFLAQPKENTALAVNTFTAANTNQVLAGITQLGENQVIIDKTTSQREAERDRQERDREALKFKITACEQRVDNFNLRREVKVNQGLNMNQNVYQIGVQILAKDGLKNYESLAAGGLKLLADSKKLKSPTADKSQCSVNFNYLIETATLAENEE